MTTTPLTLDDLSEPVGATFRRQDWNEEGVVKLDGFFDQADLGPYKAEWIQANGATSGTGTRSLVLEPGDHGSELLLADRPNGWPHCTPYRENEALRALCCNGGLADVLEDLIGEPAGVHLNLTGWVTTGRRWHQDTYLNPWFVGDSYAAAWIALGDVHPDSGPFQYIPGSHRWHRLTRDKIAPHVDMSDPDWPKYTEDFLTPLVEDEVEQRGEHIRSYLPKMGDVLIWHSRLYHQGSLAHTQRAFRPALIAHFSGIHHRPDMPPPIQHELGGWYFPVDGGPT